jgi:hypothetical protein
MDILDADIINYKISVKVVIVPGMVRNDVVRKVITELTTLSKLEKYQIGQPLIEADFMNAIYNVTGVQAIEKLDFICLYGNATGREYSSVIYDFSTNKNKGMFFLKQNSIFELKFPMYDVEVTV